MCVLEINKNNPFFEVFEAQRLPVCRGGCLGSAGSGLHDGQRLGAVSIYGGEKVHKTRKRDLLGTG